MFQLSVRCEQGHSIYIGTVPYRITGLIKQSFLPPPPPLPTLGAIGFSCAVSGVGHVSMVTRVFSRGFATCGDGRRGLRLPKGNQPRARKIL